MSKPYINLIGRLGKDPEHCGGEGQGLKFSLAVSVGKDETDWYNIVLWDEYLGNFVSKYFKKGSIAVINGLQTLKKVQEGSGSYINIQALSVQFGPPSGKKQENVEANVEAEVQLTETGDEVIPF